MSLASFRLGVAALGALFLLHGGPAAAQGDPPPPDTSAVCPSIEEDGLLCIADPLRMTGNCGDFVAAARRMSALYRAELAKLPDSKRSLLTTRWWGCGPDTLSDVKRLLVHLGTADARAVLALEPYPSLPEVPPPSPPPSPEQPFSCIDLPKPVDRNICAGASLQAVRSDHEQRFTRCKALVADALRADLLATESTFEQRVKVLCEDDTNRANESAAAASFDRAQCLIEAYRERTKAMLEMNPTCAADD